MSTIRQSILLDVQSTIQGIASIANDVPIGKLTAVALDTEPMPAAFVFSGPAERVPGAIGFETWEWNVIVDIWVKDNEDIETYIGYIHDAMYVDKRRGGYAEETIRISDEQYLVDDEGLVQGALLTFQIRFSNVWGYSGETTLPTVTAFSIPATSNSLTVAITTFTATDNISISKYLVNESSSTPAVNDAGWVSSAPATYTFSTQGNKTLYAWVKDVNNNISASLSDTVTVDTSVPVVTAFTIPATSSSLTVPISTFTATDNILVSKYLVNESSATPSVNDSGWSSSAQTEYVFSTQGSKTLYAWAKDSVGNISLSLNDSVIVDTEIPVVTAFSIPSTSNSLTVAITTFTATDNISVSKYLVNESSTTPSVNDAGWSSTPQTEYVFSTQGSKTIYAWAKDSVNNISNSASDSVIVDTEAPVITAFTIPDTGISLTVVISTFTATDNVAVTNYLVNESASTPSSGDPNWSVTPQTQYVFTSYGTKTLYAWVKDALNNISNSASDSITITLGDSFDGDGALGAIWYLPSPGGERFARVASQLKIKAGYDIAWYSGNFYNDQWSELVFKSASDDGFWTGPGVRLGGTAATNAYGYVARYRPQVGLNAIHIVKYVGQSLEGGGTLLGAQIDVSLSDGDKLKIQVIASTITVYKNDISIGVRSDSSIAGSNSAPGFITCAGLPTESNTIWDDWKGGDLV